MSALALQIRQRKAGELRDLHIGVAGVAMAHTFGAGFALERQTHLVGVLAGGDRCVPARIIEGGAVCVCNSMRARIPTRSQ